MSCTPGTLRNDDSIILAKINVEPIKDSIVKTPKIDVNVTKGVVTLSGIVDTLALHAMNAPAMIAL